MSKTVNSVSEEKINKFLEDTELKYPEYKVNSLGILYYELLDKIGKLGHKSLSIKGERYVLPGFEISSDKKTIFGVRKSTSQILGLKHISDSIEEDYTADHESINNKISNIDTVKEMIDSINKVLEKNLTDVKALGSTIEQKMDNEYLDKNKNSYNKIYLPFVGNKGLFDEITDRIEKGDSFKKIQTANKTKGIYEEEAKEKKKKGIKLEIKKLLDKINEIVKGEKEKAEEAEEKVSDAKTKVTEAETKVTEAETKVTDAKTKVTDAEKKVTEAELKKNEVTNNIEKIVKAAEDLLKDLTNLDKANKLVKLTDGITEYDLNKKANDAAQKAKAAVDAAAAKKAADEEAQKLLKRFSKTAAEEAKAAAEKAATDVAAATDAAKEVKKAAERVYKNKGDILNRINKEVTEAKTKVTEAKTKVTEAEKAKEAADAAKEAADNKLKEVNEAKKEADNELKEAEEAKTKAKNAANGYQNKGIDELKEIIKKVDEILSPIITPKKTSGGSLIKKHKKSKSEYMKYKERIENASSIKEIRKIGKHLSERLVTENYSKKLEHLVNKLVKKSSELKKKGGDPDACPRDYPESYICALVRNLTILRRLKEIYEEKIKNKILNLNLYLFYAMNVLKKIRSILDSEMSFIDIPFVKELGDYNIYYLEKLKKQIEFIKGKIDDTNLDEIIDKVMDKFDEIIKYYKGKKITGNDEDTLKKYYNDIDELRIELIDEFEDYASGKNYTDEKTSYFRTFISLTTNLAIFLGQQLKIRKIPPDIDANSYDLPFAYDTYWAYMHNTSYLNNTTNKPKTSEPVTVVGGNSRVKKYTVTQLNKMSKDVNKIKTKKRALSVASDVAKYTKQLDASGQKMTQNYSVKLSELLHKISDKIIELEVKKVHKTKKSKKSKKSKKITKKSKKSKK